MGAPKLGVRIGAFVTESRSSLIMGVFHLRLK
jgi:hypothetical protein